MCDGIGLLEASAAYLNHNENDNRPLKPHFMFSIEVIPDQVYTVTEFIAKQYQCLYPFVGL